MKPRGRTRVQEFEKNVITDMRVRGYSLQQIADYTARSLSTVKRYVYNW